MQEDYVTADQFHFIDEEDTNLNLPKTSNGTNIQQTKDSSLKIEDNNIEKVCTVDTTKIKHQCDICQKTLGSLKTLKQHVAKHLSTRKYNCNHCVYKTNEKYRYIQHLGYHTNTFKFSCEKCLFRTNYAKSLKRHSLRHGKLQRSPKTCKLCDFKTESLGAFFIHMCKHKGIVYKCEKCSYSSYSKYNLARHTIRLRH